MTDERDDILIAVADSLGASIVSSKRVYTGVGGEGVITGHELQLAFAEGEPQQHTVYIESSPRTPAGDGVLRMRDDASDEEVAVWLYPRDPRLPALPAAVYPQAAAVLMRRLGFDATGLTLSVLAYRPRKRAVVRMTTPTFSVFLKVVRPEVAELLRNRHERWRAAGIPVPRALAWANDGLVALETLPGVEALGMVPQLRSPEAFLDSLQRVTDQINGLESERPARASLITRLDWYIRRVAALSPENAPAVTNLGQVIAELQRRGGVPPALVTIHGDLHLAQLFVEANAPDDITGILDIDTAGLGDAADDSAALWSHLVVTAQHRRNRGNEEYATSAFALADLHRDRWQREGDDAFAHRAAAIAATHLLGHALSGSVTTSEALQLAHRLVTSVDESLLMSTTPTSHEQSAL